ncbi:hypothetical protein QYM36_018986 [Artemia franciscana]|uniref:dynamin GTPase n=1 Tax=Artemia franciscana TaxID=6661 RepID=A0AA88KR72_ARTSF|nr:hypothetical protein QYM36_018986 [Artemia franciscana]
MCFSIVDLIKRRNKVYLSILATEDLSWYTSGNGDDQEQKLTIPLEGIKLKELESELMTEKSTFTLYQSRGRNIYKDSKKLYVTFKDQDSYDAWLLLQELVLLLKTLRMDKESMKNKRQILTIRNAIDSYMKIVSNQVKDLVPKCIVKILLNSCKDFIQSDLLAELYHKNLANLILENEEEVNQREEKRRLYGACRDTLKVFDDIYITLFNTLFKTVNNAYKDVTTNTTTTPTTTNPATMK